MNFVKEYTMSHLFVSLTYQETTKRKPLSTYMELLLIDKMPSRYNFFGHVILKKNQRQKEDNVDWIEYMEIELFFKWCLCL